METQPEKAPEEAQSVEWREHLGTIGASCGWKAGSRAAWLERGQAFCAKLGSLNFISEATGSSGSQGGTGLVVGGRLMEPRLGLGRMAGEVWQ